MAVVFMDDFGSYGSSTSYMLQGLYAELPQISLVTDPAGSGSTVALVAFNATIPGIMRWVYPGGLQSILGAGARYYMATLPVSSSRIPGLFQIRNDANTGLASVTVTTSGRLQIRSGGTTGTVLATSTNPVIIPRSWQHLECKFIQSGATGSVEVRCEGIPVVTVTNVNIGTATIAQYAIVTDPDGTGGGQAFYVKDLIIWDGNGASNTNFVGSVYIKSLLTDSDDALNWSLVGGANGYGILDNSPPVDSTYLLATSPPPAAYVATLTNLPSDVTSVKAVMSLVRATKLDGGDATLQNSVVSGASTANGVARPVTIAPVYYYDVFQTDPATGNAWLPIAVDAMKLKLNRTV
jgi:hypothetical protein